MWDWFLIGVAVLTAFANVALAVYNWRMASRWVRLNRALLNLCVQAHLLRRWPMAHIVDDRVPPRSKRGRPQ